MRSEPISLALRTGALSTALRSTDYAARRPDAEVVVRGRKGLADHFLIKREGVSALIECDDALLPFCSSFRSQFTVLNMQFRFSYTLWLV